MSSLQQFIMRARQVTDVLVGEVPQSPLGFLLNRVEKYAEENPEEAALQAGGLALGFVLLAWGLFSLRKPRRVRIIGV
ncbi:hypothetical protein, conserved [Eimeria acervulina]|uniref:Uncharacterized protein n=1 Tax=Eimeria acervulina TaxID=5801 RepID=U6GID8_EIMAC|nr:hypothetical protein, conserved [Eimeria acervulina]CDI79337.1 hypothetical protein, conserved [Eimeria acervulina]